MATGISIRNPKITVLRTALRWRHFYKFGE